MSASAKYKSEQYRGEKVDSTNQFLGPLLQGYLASISKTASMHQELLFSLWPQVVGTQIASMTKPVRFSRGLLYVSVKNSTLLSLISSGKDKQRLLQEIRVRIPGIQIQDLVFRFG